MWQHHLVGKTFKIQVLLFVSLLSPQLYSMTLYDCIQGMLTWTGLPLFGFSLEKAEHTPLRHHQIAMQLGFQPRYQSSQRALADINKYLRTASIAQLVFDISEISSLTPIEQGAWQTYAQVFNPIEEREIPYFEDFYGNRFGYRRIQVGDKLYPLATDIVLHSEDAFVEIDETPLNRRQRLFNYQKLYRVIEKDNRYFLTLREEELPSDSTQIDTHYLVRGMVFPDPIGLRIFEEQFRTRLRDLYWQAMSAKTLLNGEPPHLMRAIDDTNSIDPAVEVYGQLLLDVGLGVGTIATPYEIYGGQYRSQMGALYFGPTADTKSRNPTIAVYGRIEISDDASYEGNDVSDLIHQHLASNSVGDFHMNGFTASVNSDNIIFRATLTSP